MAGHSKFKNIMHRKGAQDKKRAKVFSRLGREISVAVKIGGIDPESNIRLRSAIGAAKALNMPKDNIVRAIKKGETNDPDSNYQEIRYEGYGPDGVAIIIEAMTNNKNRTAAEIRSIFNKHGGNLGESGCVNWMFVKQGTIIIAKSLISEEKALEILDYEIEDLEQDDDCYTISTLSENFDKVSKILEKDGIEIDGEISLVASNIIKVTEGQSTQIVSLLEQLDDHDDIQKVHTNFEIE